MLIEYNGGHFLLSEDNIELGDKYIYVSGVNTTDIINDYSFDGFLGATKKKLVWSKNHDLAGVFVFINNLIDGD
jgi:hypothetical protein